MAQKLFFKTFNNLNHWEKCKLKLLLIFHFTTVKIVKIKEINDHKYWCGYGQRRIFSYCWCDYKLAQPVRK